MIGMSRSSSQQHRAAARAARNDARWHKNHAKSQSGANAQKHRDHAAGLIRQARNHERAAGDR